MELPRMTDPETTRKNCLQWGVRVLPPKNYYNLLKQYAVDLAPYTLARICEAHYDNDKYWWWQWLCCEIKKEKIWINIATGRRISKYHPEKIATFTSWSMYEKFREKLREETEKLQALVDGLTGTGIAILDIDGKEVSHLPTMRFRGPLLRSRTDNWTEISLQKVRLHRIFRDRS